MKRLRCAIVYAQGRHAENKAGQWDAPARKSKH